MNSKRLNGFLPFLLSLVIIMLFTSGCTKTASPEIKQVVTDMREGFNDQNIELFLRHFSDVMFTSRKNSTTYMDLIRKYRKKYGIWESEKYMGQIGEEHIWKVKCIKGKLKMALIFNDNYEVIGFDFRK